MEEAPIKINSTAGKQRFARCNNSKCRAIFLFEPREIMGEQGFLCPECRNKIDTHHVVQCTCCQSIVDFVEAEPSEVPIVFNIDKCSKCSGTVEDEKHIHPYFFPDAYI